jgi:hypothetical protein
MPKKKVTFLIDEKYFSLLIPFKFYRSFLVELALELLFEKISPEQIFKLLIEERNQEKFKEKLKQKLKEEYSLTTNEQKSIVQEPNKFENSKNMDKKVNILDKYKDFF